MDRDRLLDDVLRHLAAQRPDDARRAVERAGTTDPFARGLLAFCAFMRDVDPATADTGAADDPTTALLLAGTAMLGEARGCPGEPEDLLALAAATDPTTPAGSFALYLATEAALAAARLDLATALRSRAPGVHAVWAGHPYAPVMLACAARVEIFTGNIAAALDLLAGDAPPGPPGVLVRATRAVAAGNAADVATMVALIQEVEEAGVQPIDHLGRGIHLLLAFGVVALGDTAGAVGHLLAAGGGADLEHLTVVDRMLGYEMLVAAAADDEDLVSAEAWRDRAELASGNRIAAPALDRIRARVALLNGDAEAAARYAETAVTGAAEEARVVEQAEAEMVRARARIASRQVPEATRDLRTAVRSGDETGHHAVRVAATKVLRPARRRLPPPSGTGAAALSARERDVAELILAGADNAEIAERLSLSAATVRTHATRVLTAYGVATRVALLAATRPWPETPTRPGGLTGRQDQVAELVAAGRSNPEIAGTLGISVKSVERHVTAILLRWDLRNRFDLAHRWWAAQY